MGNNPAMFAVEAQKLYDSQKYQEALEACEEGIMMYPDYISGYVIAFRSAVKLNLLDKAESILNIAEKKFRRNRAVQNLVKEFNDIKNSDKPIYNDEKNNSSEPEEAEIIKEKIPDIENNIEEISQETFPAEQFEQVDYSASEKEQNINAAEVISNLQTEEQSKADTEAINEVVNLTDKVEISDSYKETDEFNFNINEFSENIETVDISSDNSVTHSEPAPEPVEFNFHTDELSNNTETVEIPAEISANSEAINEVANLIDTIALADKQADNEPENIRFDVNTYKFDNDNEPIQELNQQETTAIQEDIQGIDLKTIQTIDTSETQLSLEAQALNADDIQEILPEDIQEFGEPSATNNYEDTPQEADFELIENSEILAENTPEPFSDEINDSPALNENDYIENIDENDIINIDANNSIDSEEIIAEDLLVNTANSTEDEIPAEINEQMIEEDDDIFETLSGEVKIPTKADEIADSNQDFMRNLTIKLNVANRSIEHEIPEEELLQNSQIYNFAEDNYEDELGEIGDEIQIPDEIMAEDLNKDVPEHLKKYIDMKGFIGMLTSVGIYNSERKFKASDLGIVGGLSIFPIKQISDLPQKRYFYDKLPEPPAFIIDSPPILKNFSEEFGFNLSDINTIKPAAPDNSHQEINSAYTEDFDDDASEKPDIITDTIANILMMQGAYSQAVDAFAQLIDLYPDKKEFYEAKILEAQGKEANK